MSEYDHIKAATYRKDGNLTDDVVPRSINTICDGIVNNFYKTEEQRNHGIENLREYAERFDELVKCKRDALNVIQKAYNIASSADIHDSAECLNAFADMINLFNDFAEKHPRKDEYSQ